MLTQKIDQILLAAHAGGLKQGGQMVAGCAPGDTHLVGRLIQAMKGEQQPGQFALTR